MRIRAAFVLVLSVALSACGSGGAAGAGSSSSSVHAAQAASTRVHLVKIGSFQQPVYVTGAPADESRLFIVQRLGKVILMLNGHAQAHPFLDVTSLL
jgi:hypothetical protein